MRVVALGAVEGVIVQLGIVRRFGANRQILGQTDGGACTPDIVVKGVGPTGGGAKFGGIHDSGKPDVARAGATIGIALTNADGAHVHSRLIRISIRQRSGTAHGAVEDITSPTLCTRCCRRCTVIATGATDNSIGVAVKAGDPKSFAGDLIDCTDLGGGPGPVSGC